MPTQHERSDPKPWGQWAEHVLAELKEAKEARSEMVEQINELKIQIAILSTKAAILGTVSGMVTGTVVAVLAKLIFK